jgi:hypothetical protein
VTEVGRDVGHTHGGTQVRRIEIDPALELPCSGCGFAGVVSRQWTLPVELKPQETKDRKVVPSYSLWFFVSKQNRVRFPRTLHTAFSLFFRGRFLCGRSALLRRAGLPVSRIVRWIDIDQLERAGA